MGLKETTTRSNSRKQPKAPNGSQRDNNPTKKQKTAQGHQWDLKRQQPGQIAENSQRLPMGFKETTSRPIAENNSRPPMGLKTTAIKLNSRQ